MHPQFFLNGFQLLQMAIDHTLWKKRKNIFIVQTSEFCKQQQKYRTCTHRISTNGVALFTFIFQCQIIFVKCVDNDPEITKNCIPAHLTELHQLIDIYRSLAVKDQHDDQLHSFTWLKIVICVRIFFQKKSFDPISVFLWNQNSPSTSHGDLLDIIFLQPLIDPADIIVDTSSGYFHLFHQLWQRNIIVAP